jgi:hypothetical protein
LVLSSFAQVNGIFSNGFKTERYWSIVPDFNMLSKGKELSYDDTVTKTRELLKEAAKVVW